MLKRVFNIIIYKIFIFFIGGTMERKGFFEKVSLMPVLILLIVGCTFTGCDREKEKLLTLETRYNETLGENVTHGTLMVYENPDSQKGRRVGINFMILPARSANPAPDPVFIFDGGPGMGAAEGFEGWAWRFDKLRDERELVLIDQRGTGDSSPLPCCRIGDPEKAQTYLKDMFPVEYVNRCREELEKENDLRYFHTVLAIRDTDAIRQAMGYQKINVAGGSYGTYFGLLYMKHYRPYVRAAFLFSVAPPNWLYPACLAQDTEVALQRLFDDCAADPECASDYPTFKKELYSLAATLKQSPIHTGITNPINQKSETVTFTYHNFIQIIRALLYSNQRSKWIPAFIYWAYRGTWFPLVEYAVSYFKDMNDHLMDGMLLCVTCSETIPFIDVDKARQDAAGTFMGTYRIEQQTRACKLWARGRLPDGFTDMVELGIPTLLLSGENDPATPPYHGKIVKDHLPNGLHVIIPNAAHGTGDVWTGCLDDMVVKFISQGNAAGLDFACTELNTRPPFVTWRDYTQYSPRELSEITRSFFK